MHKLGILCQLELECTTYHVKLKKCYCVGVVISITRNVNSKCSQWRRNEFESGAGEYTSGEMNQKFVAVAL